MNRAGEWGGKRNYTLVNTGSAMLVGPVGLVASFGRDYVDFHFFFFFFSPPRTIARLNAINRHFPLLGREMPPARKQRRRRLRCRSQLPEGKREKVFRETMDTAFTFSVSDKDIILHVNSGKRNKAPRMHETRKWRDDACVRKQRYIRAPVSTTVCGFSR